MWESVFIKEKTEYISALNSPSSPSSYSLCLCFRFLQISAHAKLNKLWSLCYVCCSITNIRCYAKTTQKSVLPSWSGSGSSVSRLQKKRFFIWDIVTFTASLIQCGSWVSNLWACSGPHQGKGNCLGPCMKYII